MVCVPYDGPMMDTATLKQLRKYLEKLKWKFNLPTFPEPSNNLMFEGSTLISVSFPVYCTYAHLDHMHCDPVFCVCLK